MGNLLAVAAGPLWQARLVRHLAVLAMGVIFYFWQGPSLCRYPAQRLADDGDALFVAWIMAWDTHALLEEPARVWDPPIMHPVRNVLSFSEPMFGNLWLALPVNYLTGNPILATNLHILASFILCLYGMFWVVERLTGSWVAGVAAGLLFSFNPLRWDLLEHAHLLPFFWAPLALYSCHLLLEKPRWGPLLGLAGSVVVQFYTSVNLGVLLTITLLIFCGWHLLWERRGWDRLLFLGQMRPWWGLPLVGGAALGCLVWLAWPYWQTLHEWDFARSESEVVTGALEPMSFLVPPATFSGYGPWHQLWAAKIQGSGGLGLAVWFLAACGFIWTYRHGQPDSAQSRLGQRLLWTALTVAVLMLGPWLIWFQKKLPVPLPYLLVYYGLPGGRMLRVPLRFVLPLLMCLAVLGGLAVAHLVRWWPQWRWPRRAVLLIAVVAWLGWDYAVTDNQGLAFPQRTDFPPVYHYLAQGAKDRPILELPVVWHKQQQLMHFQTAHWRPLLNGYSGNFPLATLQTEKRTKGPPTEKTLQFLSLTPAQTLVIHLDLCDAATAAAWGKADLTPYGFRRAGLFADALVWERQETPLPCSDRLRVQEVQTRSCPGRWGDKVELTLQVSPANPGLPWRFLARGVQEVEITLTDARDKKQVIHRRTKVPPYLLAGESEQIKIQDLQGIVLPLTSLCLRGNLLEDYTASPAMTVKASIAGP